MFDENMALAFQACREQQICVWLHPRIADEWSEAAPWSSFSKLGCVLNESFICNRNLHMINRLTGTAVEKSFLIDRQEQFTQYTIKKKQLVTGY